MIKATFLLSILISISVFGQQNLYPKGAYLTFAELKNKAPSIPFTFKITKRSNLDIKMVGGNDYKIMTITAKGKKRAIKDDVFAISNGDTLFLNCEVQKLQSWYSIANQKDSFLLFKAGICQDIFSELSTDASLYGVLGPIGSAHAATIRYLYILNMRTGKVEILTEKYLKKILKSKADILKNYEAEKDRNSDEILLKYYELAKG